VPVALLMTRFPNALLYLTTSFATGVDSLDSDTRFLRTAVVAFEGVVVDAVFGGDVEEVDEDDVDVEDVDVLEVDVDPGFGTGFGLNTPMAYKTTISSTANAAMPPITAAVSPMLHSVYIKSPKIECNYNNI
jgi:hypothetical protein